MDWVTIGQRIRKQREFLGYTREQFAELLDVTPKFCSDIELGLKGMSVPTLCHISNSLKLSADYILFGKAEMGDINSVILMIEKCPASKRAYLESLIKTFLLAIDEKGG